MRNASERIGTLFAPPVFQERQGRPAVVQRQHRTATAQPRAAAAKAAETIAAACPRDFPGTAPARLEVMEKRLDAMLQAVKTVRPAFDAFYATLTEEQKAELNKAGPRRWGWRWWRWRQSEN